MEVGFGRGEVQSFGCFLLFVFFHTFHLTGQRFGLFIHVLDARVKVSPRFVIICFRVIFFGFLIGFVSTVVVTCGVVIVIVVFLLIRLRENT